MAESKAAEAKAAEAKAAEAKAAEAKAAESKAAEAKAAEAKAAEAKAASMVTPAVGKAVTTKEGIKSHGDSVDESCLPKESIERLIKKGILVKT